jgi:two-component system sensor histidine kinase PilS (NtrC family)
VLPFLEDYLTEGDLLSNDKPAPFPPFLELPCSLPDGEKSHLQLSISPLNLPLGDQQGHILIFQDMTEIREIEEEMKRVEGLALIGELSAGIAHEIRNPMASISGSIQMLRDSLEEDDVNRRLMDIITREINRLNDLVNDFLEFTRPKKGKLEDFDLNQLISESLELFKNSRHWSSKIEVVTDFRRPIRLHSDPAQIKQVMWNLFLNASEAMPNGGSLGVAVDLDSDGAAPQGERAKVVVRDTGDGFDEATLPHLFTPFFTTKEGGSGLGLATVKKIIEGLQGEVTGSNHPEGGAEVTIDIPISPSGKLPIQ